MIDSHRDEIAKLESLYAMNPEGRVFTHLAEACRKAGQLERARQILEEGLQKHPDYASAHVVLGRVLSDSGENETAVTEFRRVLELDRHNLVALRSLGELATQAGHTEEAIHYWRELAVLDPSDSSVQDQLRKLRENAGETTTPAPADPETGSAQAEPAAAAGPADTEAETDAPGDSHADAGGPTGGDDAASAPPEPGSEAPLAIETHEPAAADDAETVAPPVDQETTSHLEPVSSSPADEAPAVDEIELPEWQAAGPRAVPMPGEAPPIDEAAWREIAAGGQTLEPESEQEDAGASVAESEPAEGDASAPVAEAEPATADGPETVDEVAAVEDEAHHARFAPPGIFETEPEAAETVADGSAGSDEPDGPEAAGDSGGETDVEGRWQHPEPVVGDVQAERSRPTDDSGDWIPADRWEWVAASADSPDEPAAGTGEPIAGDAEPAAEEVAGSPVEEAGASPETVAETVHDEETSFAGLVEGDDEGSAAAVSVPDYESSFAELTVSAEADDAEIELEPSDEVEAVEGEAVDSFEEGAAAVLDAFAGGDGAVEDAAPASSEARAANAGSTGWIEDVEDEGDQVITETLAEIYASQGLHDRAVEVYRRLVERHPEDDRLRTRLEELETATAWGEAGEAEEEEAPDGDQDAFIERMESAWTGGEGATTVEDSLYSWGETSAPDDAEGPSAGDYFAGILAWRPSEAVPSAEDVELIDAVVEQDADATDGWYAEEAGAAGEGGAVDTGREGEEDLEMFRSWLKSLKK